MPVIISRKPERYSSAAPLTADARQRIVTELVDFPDGITISVSVRAPTVRLIVPFASQLKYCSGARLDCPTTIRYDTFLEAYRSGPLLPG